MHTKYMALQVYALIGAQKLSEADFMMGVIVTLVSMTAPLDQQQDLGPAGPTW